MATKNSGISAKLSLDTSPWEKGLRGAKKELDTFTKDLAATPKMNLGAGSFDGFTKSVGNATNELRRMKLQAESTTSSVEKGMAAMKNMASGAGGGLHQGRGRPWASEWTPPGASSPWSPAGPNSRWNPLSRETIGPRMAAPDRANAQTPAGLAAAAREQAALTSVRLLANGQTSKWVDASGKAITATRNQREETAKLRLEQEKTATGSSKLAMTMLNLGYIADDAAYGMRGVINNVAPLVMGMGLGAGVAGAVQILAVGLNYASGAWDEFTGATQRAERAVLETAATAARAGQQMKEARGRGEAEAKSRASRQQGESEFFDRTRSAWGREERVRDIGKQADLAEVGNENHGGGAQGRLERVKKENAVERAAEKSSLTERKRLATYENGANEDGIKKARQALETKLPRLKELKDNEKNRNIILEDLKAEIKQAIEDGTDQALSNKFQAERKQEALQKDDAEQAQLEASVPAIKKELADREEKKRAMEENFADLKSEGGAERAEKERLRAAKEAAAKIEADEEVARAVTKFADALHGTMRSVANWVHEAADRMKEKEKEKEKQQAGRAGRTQQDLAISEIRNPRRRERAQRAADLAAETKRLITEEGMTPGAAADVAARKQKVADRESGRKHITGALSNDQRSGLDAFNFSQRGHESMLKDGNVPTAAEASETRGRAAIRRARADAARTWASGQQGDTAGKMVGEVLAKLDQLIAATGKTPADRAKPLRAAGRGN